MRTILSVGDRVYVSGYTGRIEAVYPDEHGATYKVIGEKFTVNPPLPQGYSGGNFRAVTKYEPKRRTAEEIMDRLFDDDTTGE